MFGQVMPLFIPTQVFSMPLSGDTEEFIEETLDVVYIFVLALPTVENVILLSKLLSFASIFNCVPTLLDNLKFPVNIPPVNGKYVEAAFD